MTNFKIGYCTNIHSGADFDGVFENLKRYTKPAKEAVSPDEAMGIGLWFSNRAAAAALQSSNIAALKRWLESESLIPYTFNAFPFHDFHQPVVKHLVYEPTWAQSSRLEYTLHIAGLLDALLPAGLRGSISTLPLGWPSGNHDNEFKQLCAAHLSLCADGLAEIEARNDRRIVLCIEPEPGCCLQTSNDLVEFFNEFLFAGLSEQSQRNRRYLGVCHDVCHGAVMFEDQIELLGKYAAGNITVGKVQLSSAIEVDLDQCDDAGKSALISEYNDFAEPRYLHQTSWRGREGREFFEDLPLALEHARNVQSGLYRTHFHVPINLDRIGNLRTTRAEIQNCLEFFLVSGLRSHFEIETYAWNVSPNRLQTGTMVESLIGELKWLYEQDQDLDRCMI